MKRRVLCIGEVLFDIFPGYQSLGGAPFNFSYHMHHFNSNVMFISCIGKDKMALKILKRLKKENISLKYLQSDSVHQTGHVNVKFDIKENPQYTIIEDVSYDYIKLTQQVNNLLKRKIHLIYFGTLCQRSKISRKTIYSILKSKQSDTLIFCDMNLREPFYSKEIIDNSLLFSNIIKVNQSEFAVLKSLYKLPETENKAVSRLQRKFNIRSICITDGERGSCLYIDNSIFRLPYREKRIGVMDTVGAGDGYSAVLVYGILNGWKNSEIVRRADHFAGGICQIQGALPRHHLFYKKYACFIK